MKRKGNKQLTLFLEASGALSGTAAEQEAAKKAYRRAYMLEWKKTALRRREVRIMLTDDEYAYIAKHARMAGLKSTTYMRDFVLAGDGGCIPRRDELLVVVQKVRMARSAGDTASLAEIETLLLRYLQKQPQP